MRLRFINPNTTASMTGKVLAAARDAAPDGLAVEAVTSEQGPPAIQGEVDGRAALPGLLDAVRRANTDAVDVIVIACFDDTGINEARAVSTVPVLGIGQCAFLQSLALGRRFSVVTTLAVSVPVIEQNLARSGLAAGCARVRASDVPVLELEREGSDAEARVAAEIQHAIAEDDIAAIVLGCAGMTDLARRFEARFGLPVIDGVVAATRAAGLVIR